MKCENCDSENLNPTPATAEYPNCNTWTCEDCSHVQPEMGSLRLGDQRGDSISEVKDAGEIPLAEADDANIPVNIFITKEDDGVWTLMADNFMPRKARATDGAYRATCSKKAPLVKAVMKHWLPLYQKAIEILKGFSETTDEDESLYYWM